MPPSVAGVDKPNCDLQIYEAKLPFGAVPALPDRVFAGRNRWRAGRKMSAKGPKAGRYSRLHAAWPFLTLPKHIMRSEQDRIWCRPVRRNELAKLYTLARRNP